MERERLLARPTQSTMAAMDRLELEKLRNRILAVLQAEVPREVQFAVVLCSDEQLMFGSSEPPDATRGLLMNAAFSLPRNVARF